MNLTLVNCFPVAMEQNAGNHPHAAIVRWLFVGDRQVLSSDDFQSRAAFEQSVEAMADAMGEVLVQYDCFQGDDETSESVVDRLRQMNVFGVNGDKSDWGKGDKVRFVIHLDGGLVQSVLCKDPRGRNALFSVLDYDTDSVEDDEITLVTDLNDGNEEEAFVHHVQPSFNAAINLDDVFNAK